MREQTTQFDFDSIDEDNGWVDTNFAEEIGRDIATAALARMVAWAFNFGNRKPHNIQTRLLALYWVHNTWVDNHLSQRKLAAENDISAKCLSQAVQDFQRRFNYKNPQLKTNDARNKYSAVRNAYHATRRAEADRAAITKLEAKSKAGRGSTRGTRETSSVDTGNSQSSNIININCEGEREIGGRGCAALRE